MKKNPSYVRRRSMKIILTSKRHHYVARVSIVLITVALIAGVVGCDFSPPGGVRHSLSISSTEGGSVTEPGEGAFPLYSEGRVVDLVATPDSGYQFDEWTGDVGTIADVEDATTTITMHGTYVITAKFVPG
jgi:hypothetical protein